MQPMSACWGQTQALADRCKHSGRWVIQPNAFPDTLQVLCPGHVDKLPSQPIGVSFCAAHMSACRCPTVTAARQQLFCTPACAVGALMAC